LLRDGESTSKASLVHHKPIGAGSTSINNRLEAKTKYFWQVVAVTTQGEELISAMSWFITK
jgi:hypothetical protein